jgi:hypothetical protein
VATAVTSIRHAPVTETSVRTLDRLTQDAHAIDGIWVDGLEPGDFIVVRTRNSVYALVVLGDGRYRVTGGWFEATGANGSDVRVAGCTWGGAAIHTKLVAAAGMFLEFDNGVRTTRIRDVRLFRIEHKRTH